MEVSRKNLLACVLFHLRLGAIKHMENSRKAPKSSDAKREYRRKKDKK
jgi:hypothetical protein